MSAFTGAGLAQGAANVAEYERGREMRNIQLEQANLQLDTAKKLAPMQVSQTEQQLKQLEMQNKQIAGQMFKRDTFDAFRLFEADGDTKHLNNFLSQAKQSPVGGSLFKDVTRVDRLASSPDTIRMMEQAGIRDAKAVIDNPELSKGLVMATMADGSQQLIDMEKVYAGTGFAGQLATEELDLFGKRALALQRLRQGSTVEKLTATERVAKQMAADMGIPEWEAFQMLQKGQQSAQGTENERIARALMAQNPGMDYITAMDQAIQMKAQGSETERTARRLAEESGEDYNTVLRRLQQEKQAPTSVREADAANKAAAGLDEQFGGKFFATDFSDPTARRAAQPYIRELEATTGIKMSNEDKKVARQMRQLVGLGNRAGEAITPEETGLLDNLLSNVNSYISDTVTDGKKGVAAYESFRNVVRNALFGSALTGAEIDAFNKAAGTLSQQQGPVLAKFQEQLKIVRDNLQGIYNINDEHLSHYYLGADVEKVDDIIGALDQRISLLQKRVANSDKPAPEVPASALPKKPLAEIFGAKQ
jgi:hypothetical protein